LLALWLAALLALVAAMFALAAFELALAALLTVLATWLAAVWAWLAADWAAFAAELAALAAEFRALATDLLTLAVLLSEPPHAIPSAPRAKRVESAMIFFICGFVLLSSSKINTYLFLLSAAFLRQRRSRHPFLEQTSI
jgi:hypothetical protein